jgi:uroporphyrinogen decarboxylase
MRGQITKELFMKAMTAQERIRRSLARQPVDRIGVCEEFWPQTGQLWRQQGHIAAGKEFDEHFDHDLIQCWPFHLVADLDFKDEVLEEDAQTKLIRNGNGAIMRWMKDRTGTPEHVDFTVKDRAGWEELIRPKLLDDDLFSRRIASAPYAKTLKRSREQDRFFVWAGVNVFECMHPVCGHEYMLMGMALDPDWIRDMCEVYADLTIRCMEELFAKEGKPDGVWFYEDMGFKERPFMSPAMYKEIIWPSHKRTFDYVHSLGLPVIVHSCGFVEPLIPGLIEAGMDCLEAMEIKAGMDLLRIKKQYGDQISLCGGMDIRVLETNDLGKVQAMLEANLPAAMAGGGYILHTDHSIPPSVNYETYRFFVDKGREIGTYR